MKEILAKLALVVILIAAAALIVWPAEVWRLTAGEPDLGPVTFKDFTPKSSPNTFLVCPKDVCRSHPYSDPAPEFPLAAPALMAKAVALWRAEPRVEMVDHALGALTVRFVQRSSLLKFPDTITVQFYPLAEDRATLAIYSRSQIGYHDMGANEARVLHWLRLLEAK